MPRQVLTLARGSQPVVRHLLTDTGAGTAGAGIDLVLDEDDCLQGNGILFQTVTAREITPAEPARLPSR